METLDAKARRKLSYQVKAKVGNTVKSALVITKDLKKEVGEKMAESKAKREAKKAEKQEAKRRKDSVID
jgi:hypothetical protein